MWSACHADPVATGVEVGKGVSGPLPPRCLGSNQGIGRCIKLTKSKIIEPYWTLVSRTSAGSDLLVLE
jgi:hypothetical protein